MQDSLRAAIGVVTQDSSLLHRSVRDNIAYGKPDATEAELQLAAEQAEASDFISDFINAGQKNGAWWDWQPAKQALEQLFMQGKLMVARRDKFQKVYDLAERVWPDHAESQPPTEAEFADYLIDRCLQSQAVATVQQIGYLRKNMQAALKSQLQQQLEQGTDFRSFFTMAPAINPNVALIKGVVCGVRVEEVTVPLMQKIRYLDKLIDELAKGKRMEKILR